MDFDMALTDQRVIVTGGTGFIGSHLVRRLVREGAKVTVFTRHTSDRRRIQDVLQQIDLREVDIRTYGAVSSEMDKVKPDVVFHLGAEGVSDPFISHTL